MVADEGQRIEGVHMRLRDIQRRRGTPGGQQRRGSAARSRPSRSSTLAETLGYLEAEVVAKGHSVQTHDRTVGQRYGNAGEAAASAGSGTTWSAPGGRSWSTPSTRRAAARHRRPPTSPRPSRQLDHAEQFDLDGSDDAEAATATADRPEQRRLVIGIDTTKPPVGRD